MVKKGGKLRNRSVTPEDEGSAAKSVRDSGIDEDPKLASMKQSFSLKP
ncbi:unnamed protein product, partial [Arabidopsis halleri]